MRSRFPQFALPEDHVAVFEANAGYALAEPSVLAATELALDAGAELWFDTEVETVQLGPDGVYVQAADVEVTADKAVIATGAWACRLANLHLYPVSVTRQTVHWFEPVAGLGALESFAPDRLPVYLWEWPGDNGDAAVEIYGFPYLQGDFGVKVGLYRDGSVTDPDTVDRVVTDADAEHLAAVLRRSLPSLAGRRVLGSVCLYAGVPDDDFVLGVHPGSSGRVVLAVGFSGHGFKFMPVVGEVVADLVQAGTTPHEIGFLSPSRIPTI
jgi:sarcosine oxidase